MPGPQSPDSNLVRDSVLLYLTELWPSIRMDHVGTDRGPDLSQDESVVLCLRLDDWGRRFYVHVSNSRVGLFDQLGNMMAFPYEDPSFPDNLTKLLQETLGKELWPPSQADDNQGESCVVGTEPINSSLQDSCICTTPRQTLSPNSAQDESAPRTSRPICLNRSTPSK